MRLLLAWVAVAEAGTARRVEATVDADELTLALLPDGEPREWTLCSGDCPSGVGVVHVSEPSLAMSGGSVMARGKVHTQVSMIGGIDAWVACSVAPTLREGGQVHAVGRGCRIERIAGISSILRGAIVATVEPVLGALLEEQLAAADAWDLLSVARQGMLAAYSTDPALRAPAAGRCVEGVGGVTVRDGELVVAVDVGC